MVAHVDCIGDMWTKSILFHLEQRPTAFLIAQAFGSVHRSASMNYSVQASNTHLLLGVGARTGRHREPCRSLQCEATEYL